MEKKLLSCNDWQALAEYGLWCETSEICATKLKELAAKLETKKSELKIKLQRVDEQLAQHGIASEWTITPDCIRLIPTAARALDPGVILRSMVMTQNRGKTDLEICRSLDSYWRDGQLPAGFFPASWTRDFGVKTFVQAYCHPDCRKRVEPMISSEGKKVPSSLRSIKT